MKLKTYFRLFVLSLIILGALISISPNSSIAAPYGGAWVPTSNNSITIDLTYLGGNLSLYMYDWGASNDFALVIPDGVHSFANISFSQVGNDWNVNISSSNGQFRSLTLNDNNQFGFFFKSTSNDFFTYDLLNSEGGGYQIGIQNDSGSMQVLSLGMAPVPIPAAAWMLGAGLVGLVAVRRNKKT
jgi:hypothetical protein